MRSHQELEVVSALNQNYRHCVKSHRMEHVVGILLYNSFIELPESNETFGEKQGLFQLSKDVKQGEKNMLCSA